MNIITGQVKTLDIRQEGERVLLIYNGQTTISLPWKAALEVAKALTIQAKKAEELANAERIISDQAILTRVGFPIGLTNHPAMLKEAMKEAAWNSNLRRYIPPMRAGGIASQAVFGTPSISQAPPKGANL